MFDVTTVPNAVPPNTEPSNAIVNGRWQGHTMKDHSSHARPRRSRSETPWSAGVNSVCVNSVNAMGMAILVGCQQVLVLSTPIKQS